MAMQQTSDSHVPGLCFARWLVASQQRQFVSLCLSPLLCHASLTSGAHADGCALSTGSTAYLSNLTAEGPAAEERQGIAPPQKTARALLASTLASDHPFLRHLSPPTHCRGSPGP